MKNNIRYSLHRHMNTAMILCVIFIVSGCQTTNSANSGSKNSNESLFNEFQPFDDGPILLVENITLRKIVDIGIGGIKLAVNPHDQSRIYYARPTEGIFTVIIIKPFTVTKVSDIKDITEDGVLGGMKFGPDGILYVVVNKKETHTLTQAIIYKGNISSVGKITWKILASTEPYPSSNNNFDHLFNGIAVSPDNQWVYLSSGSRTDHGEIQDTINYYPGMREVPLTSAIIRIPTYAEDLIIPNDEKVLREQGYLFADGTRNAYDLEFAPNGDLFGVDNGPDADYPEELNWLQEGLHYGFPWRFGNQDNPQQFSDYDKNEDNRLSFDFVAVQGGTYINDPTFPPPPTQFTDPIVNFGPDAAQYRDDEGNSQDATEEGGTLSTFTPHRSPLGLVFVVDSSVPDNYKSDNNSISAFVLSWGSVGGTLSDNGQDLLHLILTKNDDNYSVVTRQIVRGFNRPIDAVMIGNQLYVLDYDGSGTIWELTFEQVNE